MQNTATLLNIVPEPQIGIFWFVPSQGAFVLVSEAIPLSLAEPYGDCLTYPRGHHEVWEAWRLMGSIALLSLNIPIVVIDHEYEYFPRGRIVYEKVNLRFVVYADARLLHPATMREIVDRFDITKLDWISQGDLHYR